MLKKFLIIVLFLSINLLHGEEDDTYSSYYSIFQNFKPRLFMYELSILGSYSNYSSTENNKTIITSWGASFGLTFLGTETIELEYKSTIQKSQDINFTLKTYYDTYGINYVHALSKSRFQPFIKLGLGYVTTKYEIYSNEYPDINQSIKMDPTTSYLGGIGLKIYITNRLSLKGAYVAQYIDQKEEPNGDKKTQFNYFVTLGASLNF